MHATRHTLTNIVRCQRHDEERVLPRLHMHNLPSPAHALLVKALLRGSSPTVVERREAHRNAGFTSVWVAFNGILH